MTRPGRGRRQSKAERRRILLRRIEDAERAVVMRLHNWRFDLAYLVRLAGKAGTR
mgnify:CR=1 FL=1